MRASASLAIEQGRLPRYRRSGAADETNRTSARPSRQMRRWQWSCRRHSHRIARWRDMVEHLERVDGAARRIVVGHQHGPVRPHGRPSRAIAQKKPLLVWPWLGSRTGALISSTAILFSIRMISHSRMQSALHEARA